MFDSGGTATVGRKKSSEKRRFNTLVRMDDELCEKSRKLAMLKGISMAEMFAGVLQPWVDKEWAKEVAKESRKLKGGVE